MVAGTCGSAAVTNRVAITVLIAKFAQSRIRTALIAQAVVRPRGLRCERQPANILLRAGAQYKIRVVFVGIDPLSVVHQSLISAVLSRISAVSYRTIRHGESPA